MSSTYKQLSLPLTWRLSFRPEEYVVSDCNKYAVEWLEKWPFKINESFACLVGTTGSGKSHLAGIWAKRVGAEVFAARSKVFEKWFEMSSNSEGRYFVLDDADLIDDDVLLFYIYNTIKEHNAYMLLTAKEPPIKWNIRLPDVRSRLLTISVLTIMKPDEKAIGGIIRKMLEQRGLCTADNVVSYLENNVERSYESINYWVNTIDSRIGKNSKLTLELVKKIISSTMF